MKSFRACWSEDSDDAIGARPPLRVVPRTAPSRPRWWHLYLGLGTIGVIGTAAHFVVNGTALLEVVDVAFALALFATLAGWVHLNRLALTRLGEPDAGTGPPRVRIVRSRARAPEEAYADDGVVRLAPDERVVLPYDFR
jgi:hypothetical protein